MYEKIMTFFAHVRWEWLIRIYKNPSYISLSDKEEIKKLIQEENYIFLTFDPYSFSGMFVIFGTLVKTGRIPEYTHALINLDLDPEDEYEFVEATSLGVNPSSFEYALGKAKKVCILRFKNYQTNVIKLGVEHVRKNIGKGYDFGFNLSDSSKMTCVELVWDLIKTFPDYEEKCKFLKFLIEYEGQLTPQMFRDCPDLEVVLEIKK